MVIMLTSYMVLSQKSENMSEVITDEDRVSDSTYDVRSYSSVIQLKLWQKHTLKVTAI